MGEVLPVLPEVERLQAVTVAPGDTLIASVSVGCPQDVIEAVYGHLTREFPENTVLVFAGVELWVGRNPDDNEEQAEVPADSGGLSGGHDATGRRGVVR